MQECTPPQSLARAGVECPAAAPERAREACNRVSRRAVIPVDHPITVIPQSASERDRRRGRRRNYGDRISITEFARNRRSRASAFVRAAAVAGHTGASDRLSRRHTEFQQLASRHRISCHRNSIFSLRVARRPSCFQKDRRCRKPKPKGRSDLPREVGRP